MRVSKLIDENGGERKSIEIGTVPFSECTFSARREKLPILFKKNLTLDLLIHILGLYSKEVLRHEHKFYVCECSLLQDL